MACGSLTFSLSVFEEKSPYRVGRHVLNRLKVDKHGSGFLFSLAMLKRKAPFELGAMFFDLKIKYMASGIKTRTFGRHVGRLKIVIMACGSFNFFSLVFEEKSPYRVGCHVLNVGPKKGVNLSTDR